MPLSRCLPLTQNSFSRSTPSPAPAAPPVLQGQRGDGNNSPQVACCFRSLQMRWRTDWLDGA